VEGVGEEEEKLTESERLKKNIPAVVSLPV
jgi:hypothetical protein